MVACAFSPCTQEEEDVEIDGSQPLLHSRWEAAWTTWDCLKFLNLNNKNSSVFMTVYIFQRLYVKFAFHLPKSLLFIVSHTHKISVVWYLLGDFKTKLVLLCFLPTSCRVNAGWWDACGHLCLIHRNFGGLQQPPRVLEASPKLPRVSGTVCGLSIAVYKSTEEWEMAGAFTGREPRLFKWMSWCGFWRKLIIWWGVFGSTNKQGNWSVMAWRGELGRHWGGRHGSYAIL